MLYRCLPYINLFVTSSAFLFQVTVAYPYNNKLGIQINRIERDIFLLQKNEINIKK